MITLITSPNKYQPAYGNIVLQFESTNQTTQYKFRYVVDIYADNQYITRLKITPQNNDWGQCDISDILRNYVNSKPVNMGCNDYTPINQCGWGYLNEDIINYRAYVGEEYATTETGDVSIYNGKGSLGAPAVSWDKANEKYVFNGVKEWFDGKNFPSSPFYLNELLPTTQVEPWDDHRYMTNAPRIQYVRDGEYATLAALNPRGLDRYIQEDGFSAIAEPVFSAKFEFYNVNNSLILTGRTYNLVDNCGWRPNCSGTTSSILPGANYQKSYISYVGTGPANLLEHTLSVPSDTKYYRVCLEKSADVITGTTPTPTPSPSSTPTADCDCKVYDIYNPNSESSCQYQYQPCPGGSYVMGTVAPFTIARVESCSVPTEGLCSGNLVITYIRDCECPVSPSPTPTPTPSSTPGVIETLVIALNRCAEETEYVHFVLNSTAGSPTIGEFFCYNGEVYEVITFGGGGFITTTVNTFYSTYGAAYAVCPCTTGGDGGNCQPSVQISEWFYYYYDGECSPNSQRIMFQNKLGTFDYYTMRAISDVGYNVDRQTYTETPELYVNGWNSNSYEGWLYNTKVWNNNQSKTGILRTGYIPKSDAIWLAEELLRSPRVYMVDSNGDLEPIILTNNEVVEPNPDRPGVMEIVVEYQGGYKEIRQNN